MTQEQKEEQEENLFTESAKVDAIRDFFKMFKNQEKFVYLDKIEQLITRDFISIDPQDFFYFKFSEGLNLYNYLIDKPTEFIKNAKRAITEIFQDNPHNSKKDFEIIIYEVERKLSLTEALGNKHINKIVTLTGIITSKTSIFNIPEELKFICPAKHVTKISYLNQVEIKTPSKCPNTKCTHKDLEIQTNDCKFSRHRILYLKSEDEESLNQEDELRIDVRNALCDFVNIGDRVKVTGIIKTKLNKKDKSQFQNIIRCLGIQKLDDVDLSITKDDEKEFKEFPNQDDFYTRLIHSIIYFISNDEFTIKKQKRRN